MKISKTTLPLERLALIFLAMCGYKGAQAVITVGEIEQFQPAETFTEFLEIYQCPVFEKVLK